MVFPDLKEPALVADVVVGARQHAARRRPHRPAVVVFGAVAAAVAEGSDEGGVDRHAREELADLGRQRLLLREVGVESINRDP